MPHELLTPDTCALALIDYQPQMFFGTHSHDRTTIVHNVQVLAKSARLFNVPRSSRRSPRRRSAVNSSPNPRRSFPNKSRSTVPR